MDPADLWTHLRLEGLACGCRPPRGPGPRRGRGPGARAGAGRAGEWPQPIFGRPCDLKDWLADAAASVIAAGAMGVVWWLARRCAGRLQGTRGGATMGAQDRKSGVEGKSG